MILIWFQLVEWVWVRHGPPTPCHVMPRGFLLAFSSPKSHVVKVITPREEKEKKKKKRESEIRMDRGEMGLYAIVTVYIAKKQKSVRRHKTVRRS